MWNDEIANIEIPFSNRRTGKKRNDTCGKKPIMQEKRVLLNSA